MESRYKYNLIKMNFNVIFVLIIGAVVAKKSYEGYSVFRVIPKTNDDVDVLNDIRMKSVGEFWDDQFNINYPSRIMVSKDNRETFMDIFVKSSMEPEELIKNLQRTIDEQLKPVSLRSKEEFLGMSWNDYYDLNKINKWLDEIVKTYPNIVTPKVMGKSVERRELRGIVIRYKPRTNGTVPLIGMLEGTIHAREWISTATVTWTIKEFLTSTDSNVRALAENIEWHIFPVVNPDGYNYTFTTNRLWRKNRSTRSFTSCAASGVDDDMSNGVDLNRNFNFVWNSAGTSQDPCFYGFAGPFAFSEPESRAIANYVKSLNSQGRMIYYIAFHSYSQLIIIPYSHLIGTEVSMANNCADMYEISIRSAEKLKKRFGTQYKVGISSEVMYPMSGASFDWVKNTTNVPVSLLMELRDVGEYAFLLPPDQIIPNNLEIMDAFLEMETATRAIGYYTFSGAGNLATSFIIVMFNLILSLL